MVSFGQYPPARRVIVHLSDTHLLAGNRPLGGRYDTAANLRATLAAVERTGVRPDGPFVSLSWPVLVAANAAALGVPVCCTSTKAWAVFELTFPRESVTTSFTS